MLHGLFKVSFLKHILNSYFDSKFSVHSQQSTEMRAEKNSISSLQQIGKLCSKCNSTKFHFWWLRYLSQSFDAVERLAKTNEKTKKKIIFCKNGFKDKDKKGSEVKYSEINFLKYHIFNTFNNSFNEHEKVLFCFYKYNPKGKSYGSEHFRISY